MKHINVIGYTLAASLILAACSEDITGGNNAKRAIAFEATTSANIVSNTAKASVPKALEMKADDGKTYYINVSVSKNNEGSENNFPSIMRGSVNTATQVNTGFSVTAFKHASANAIATPNFFYNKKTTYSSSKHSPGTYYWPTDGDVLTFLAHYPQASSASGLTLSDESTSGPQTITYVAPAIANQPDLLVAKLEKKKFGETGVGDDGSTTFNFEHALAAVKFVAGSIPAGKITSITLNNIKDTGTYTYEIDGTSTVGNWSVNSHQTTFTLSPSDMEGSGIVSSTSGDISSSDKLLMLPPQEFTSDDSKIVIEYEDNKGGEHTMTASLKGTQWDAGNTITYTIGTSGITSFTAVYPSGTNAWKNGSTYEQGPVSEYTSTESFGMFVVNKSRTIVYSNVKMKSGGGSSATLTVEDGIDNFYFSKDYKYFLYYPYQEDNDLKTIVNKDIATTYNTYYKQGATIDADRYATADKFLENVSGNWEVSTTQTDESKWRDQDLQTAEISLTTNTSTKITTGSATMKHRMGLAIINLAKNQKTGVVAKRFYVDATYYWNTMATATMTVQPSGTFSSASGNTLPLGTSNTRYCILSTTQSTSFTTTSTYTVSAFSASLSSGGADSGNNWTWSGTGTDNTVTSIEPAAPSTTYYAWEKYTIAIGDVLYSDGSLSKCTNSALTSVEYKNRKAIALVFSTTTSTADKAKWKHGYAWALKNSSTVTTWSSTSTLINTATSRNEIISDKDGYTKSQNIKTYATNNGGFNATTYPAVYYALNYSETCPSSSSGWYLQSCGQMYDISVNLGGLTTSYDPSRTDRLFWANPNGINTVSGFNTRLQILIDAGRSNVTLITINSTNAGFYTSSEGSATTAWEQYYVSYTDIYPYNKTNTGLTWYIRPVLAF